MSLRIVILLLFGVFTFISNAQVIKIGREVMHWEGGFNAGLNNDGYEMSFCGFYFPVQYIGLKAGLGFAGEIEEVADWGKEEWETGHTYAVRFKFNPAFVLRSPRLIQWKSQDAGFYIFTEPGFVLSPGAIGSKHAEYLRWDFKSGINMQIDRYIFTLGYGISNFSLYSGSPYNHLGLPDKMDYITHTVFIGGSCKF